MLIGSVKIVALLTNFPHKANLSSTVLRKNHYKRQNACWTTREHNENGISPLGISLFQNKVIHRGFHGVDDHGIF